MRSVALSREEGKTSVGSAVLPPCGGFDAAGELVRAEMGVVEAKRMLAALCVKVLDLNNEFLVYILADDAPFFERRGLDRPEAFCTSEEHWSSQQLAVV